MVISLIWVLCQGVGCCSPCQSSPGMSKAFNNSCRRILFVGYNTFSRWCFDIHIKTADQIWLWRVRKWTAWVRIILKQAGTVELLLMNIINQMKGQSVFLMRSAIEYRSIKSCISRMEILKYCPPKTQHPTLKILRNGCLGFQEMQIHGKEKILSHLSSTESNVQKDWSLGLSETCKRNGAKGSEYLDVWFWESYRFWLLNCDGLIQCNKIKKFNSYSMRVSPHDQSGSQKQNR